MKPKHIATVLLGLMLPLLAYQAYSLNKVRVAKPENTIKIPVSTSVVSSAPPLNKLIAHNLFGKAENKKAVIQPKTDNLPMTSLKLTLLGVIKNTGDDKDSALIKNGNKTKRYYLGEKVDGSNAKIYEVKVDAVILQSGSRLETLTYPKGTGGINKKVMSKSSLRSQSQSKKLDIKQQKLMSEQKQVK